MWNVKRGIETRRITAVFVSLLGLFAALSKPARAGEAPPPAGIIVSIRGNILEVQPAWLTGHQRLMIDEKTKFVEELLTPVRRVPIGTRMVVFGSNNPKEGLTGFYMIAGDLKSQGFGAKLSGIMQSQWGSYWGGVVKSVRPLVLTDDDGKDITTAHLQAHVVHFDKAASVSELLIGTKISYVSDRTQGGIHHCTSIGLTSSPGKAGVLFATVVANAGRKLTVIPRFGSTPVDITVPASCKVQRQVTLDADAIKPGDTVSAWGVPMQGRDNNGLIAFAMMRGKKLFPIASNEAGAPDRNVTGVVKYLSPFTLTVDKGPLPVYVTGQTPLVDFAPASASHLHKGDMVMFVVSKTSTGILSARYILVDASPIIAFASAG